MSIPVLIRSVGPEPSAGYYTQWTTFVPGYPKFKNQDTGVSQAFYAPDGVTLTAYRAHYLYFTGMAGEIIDRLVDIPLPLPSAGQYYDIPVTAYDPGSTGLNPNPGSSSGTAQPSGPARLDITVSESFALSTGDLKVTPWHLPRFTQERAVSGAQWANLSAVQAEDYATAASVPLASGLTTELLGQDFGFNLPLGAVVTGVEVEIARKVQAGAAEKSQPMVSVGTGSFSVTSIVYGDDWFNLQPVASGIGQGNIYFGYNNGVWIAAVDRASTIGIFRSVDGKVWTEISHASAATSARGVAYGDGIWIVTQYGAGASLDTVLRSTDNGLTWTVVTLGFGTSTNVFKSPPVSNGAGIWLVAGNNGGVSRSTDDGATWALIGTTLGGAVSKVFWTGTKFVAVTQGDFVANSVDGLTWVTRDYGATVMGASSAWPVFMDGKVVYIDTTNGNIFYSSDSGDSWSVAATPALDPIYSNAPGYSVYYDELNSVYRWLGTYSASLGVQLESDDFPPTAFRITDYPAALNFWQDWEVARAPAVADKYGLSFEATRLLAPKPVSGQIFDEGRELAASSLVDIFVVLGQDSTFLTSPDGITWTQRTLPIGGQISACAWNGTVFCALIYGSATALTSPDGITWTPRTLPLSASWTDIEWNGSVFCGVAAGSSNAVTSPDGISWTQRPLPLSSQWRSIAWNGTVFCAVAYGSSVALTSPDGITWTQRTMPSAASWGRIFWNGTKFLAVAGYGVASSSAATSPDGIAWTARTLPFQAAWNNIAWNGSVFCVSNENSTSVVITSPDGITWTQRTLPVTINSGPVVWGAGVFVLVSTSPGLIALTSPDGITWTQRTLPIAGYWGHGTAEFATAGTPAITFEYDESELFEGRNSASLATWDVGRFGGDSLRGADASLAEGTRTWTAAEINDPAFGVGYFARGQQGTLEVAFIRARIHYRADPTTDTLPAKRSAGLAGVAESPSGVKVAVGVDGKILRKPANNPTWAPVSSGTTVSLNAVEWVGDRFVAVGMFGMALDGGADGSTWTRIDTGAVSSLWAIKRVPNSLRAVAVGNDDYSFERGRNGGWTT